MRRHNLIVDVIVIILSVCFVASLFGCSADSSGKNTNATGNNATQSTGNATTEKQNEDISLTKEYYTLEDFASIIIGESTFYDVYDLAPNMRFLSGTSYGARCEYPMKDGALCIKFSGKDMVVLAVEEVYPATDITAFQKQNILDCVTKRYSVEELNAICEDFDTITELHQQYPIEFGRSTDDGGFVAYLGENHIAILYFDMQGMKNYGRVSTLSVKKECFEDIIGTQVNKVQEIDPNGSYLFLYITHSDVSKVSTHYTEDGYLVELTYDAYYCVEKITIELI